MSNNAFISAHYQGTTQKKRKTFAVPVQIHNILYRIAANSYATAVSECCLFLSYHSKDPTHNI